jgi:type IV pilus assembly protein PilM
LTSLSTLEKRPARRPGRNALSAWLDAVPHPPVVLEIAATHVAAARWGRTIGQLVASAVEPLPEGAIVPSATQANIVNAGALSSSIRSVLARVPAEGQHVALLVPDPVIRVFILPFDTFPRRADEALQLLRWRLKKILPFDAEEAVISWRRQQNREGKPEIVTAVARQKIIREYEAAMEEHGVLAGVVQSSTLATLPILDTEDATLLARMGGRNLTTVIVRGETLCVYRSSELGTGTGRLAPQAVLDEVFPAVAFYQDTWGGKVGRLRVAGFADAEHELREHLERELGCDSSPLAGPGELPEAARSLVAQGLESLVGWQLHNGA